MAVRDDILSLMICVIKQSAVHFINKKHEPDRASFMFCPCVSGAGNNQTLCFVVEWQQYS